MLPVVLVFVRLGFCPGCAARMRWRVTVREGEWRWLCRRGHLYATKPGVSPLLHTRHYTRDDAPKYRDLYDVAGTP